MGHEGTKKKKKKIAQKRNYSPTTRVFRSFALMKRRRAHVDIVETPAPPVKKAEPWWYEENKEGFIFPIVGDRDLTSEMADPKKAPARWRQQWDAIMAARASTIRAPVDEMGCERLFQKDAPPNIRRFHMLVALMLSPQSKDEKTKESMDNLWAMEGGLTPSTIVAMKQEDLEVLIRPSGLYRNKAKSLILSSKLILDQFGGDVPTTLDGMLSLSGVGPKIANLAMSACWRADVGIGCDTHVQRISKRLRWAKGDDAESVRKDLEAWLPKSLWRPINYAFVGFGQKICAARPKCGECPVAALCPSREKQ